jgi:hypothetical protein
MPLSSHYSWFDHANNIYSQQVKCITTTTLVVMTYPISDDGCWTFCIIQWHWRKRLLCVLLNIQIELVNGNEYLEIFASPFHTKFFLCPWTQRYIC